MDTASERRKTIAWIPTTWLGCVTVAALVSFPLLAVLQRYVVAAAVGVPGAVMNPRAIVVSIPVDVMIIGTIAAANWAVLLLARGRSVLVMIAAAVATLAFGVILFFALQPHPGLPGG